MTPEPVSSEEDLTGDSVSHAAADDRARVIELTKDGAQAARVLHKMAVEDNPAHVDWTDCATTGPCRDEGERFAILAQRAAPDHAPTTSPEDQA